LKVHFKEEGMRVSTNAGSLTAQRVVGNVKREQEKALSRLSSGNRIYEAAQDPAGLAISEKMRAHIGSMYQAERNSQEAVSMFQVGEGALSTIHELSTRLRELAIQSANDTLGDGDRLNAEKEFQSVKTEISRISAATNYNGKYLLNGDGSNYQIQAGIHNNQHEQLNYDMNRILSKSNLFGGGSTSITTKEGAQDAITSIAGMVESISSSRAEIGALTNRIESSINNNIVARENLSSSRSKIRDADVAAEAANNAKANIVKESGIMALNSINATPNLVLRLVS